MRVCRAVYRRLSPGISSESTSKDKAALQLMKEQELAARLISSSKAARLPLSTS